MSAKASQLWFWSDWAGDPAVRQLTPAERGMWIDLLCLAFCGTPKGYVTDAKGRALSVEAIARFANCGSAEASELVRAILEKGAGMRDRAGRLFNRRMVRDASLSAKRRAAGAVGGQRTALRNQELPPASQVLLEQLPQQTGRAPFQERKNTFPDSEIARAKPRAPTSPLEQATRPARKEPPSTDQAERAQQRIEAIRARKAEQPVKKDSKNINGRGGRHRGNSQTPHTPLNATAKARAAVEASIAEQLKNDLNAYAKVIEILATHKEREAIWDRAARNEQRQPGSGAQSAIIAVNRITKGLPP